LFVPKVTLKESLDGTIDYDLLQMQGMTPISWIWGWWEWCHYLGWMRAN